MTDATEKCDDSILVENRLNDAKLGNVTPPAEGVVMDHNIAGVEILGTDLLDRSLDDVDNSPKMSRTEFGLCDHLALFVKDSA